MLPENGVPTELEAVMRHEEDAQIATQEREGYTVNEDDEEGGETHTVSTKGYV